METEIEKYKRWLAGMEKAKKMWFEKYREMRRQRDAALYELRQTKKLLKALAGVRHDESR